MQAEAGGLLLYCPIVRADELEASLAYLARRFDENTTPENFLRAMFDLTPGSPAWDEQAARFRRSVAQRSTVDTSPRRPGVAVDVDCRTASSTNPTATLTDAGDEGSDRGHAVGAPADAHRRSRSSTTSTRSTRRSLAPRRAVTAWSARLGERARPPCCVLSRR